MTEQKIPRIIFAGGGDERASLPLDSLFASWLGAGARLLYLPTALVDPSSMLRGVRWINEVFNPLGMEHIEPWIDLEGKTSADLARFDGVYIGGGNTFYLLDQIRRHHLDAPLVEFILSGRPAYGGSAGAIALSKSITPSAHIDENIVRLEDMSGLDLALGYAVWCHYTPADDGQIFRYVRSKRIPSAAVSEWSGLYREGEHLYAAGYEPAFDFTSREKIAVNPGERLI